MALKDLCAAPWLSNVAMFLEREVGCELRASGAKHLLDKAQHVQQPLSDFFGSCSTASIANDFIHASGCAYLDRLHIPGHIIDMSIQPALACEDMSMLKSSAKLKTAANRCLYANYCL